MSLLPSFDKKNVDELMRLAAKSGEGIVFDMFSDKELHYQLLLRFCPTQNIPFGTCIDSFSSKDIVIIDYESFKDTACLTLHESRDHIVGVFICRKIKLFSLHINNFGPYLHDNMLKIDLNSLYCDSFSQFDFFKKRIWENPSIQHLLIRGDLSSSYSILLDQNIQQSTRKLETLSILVTNSTNERLEQFSKHLEEFPVKKIVLYVMHLINVNTALKFLHIKHLKYAKLFVNAFAEKQEKTEMKIRSLIQRKRNLIGGDIGMLGRQIELEGIFKKNKEIAISHRVSDIVSSLFPFNLSPYVILWILDCLYEFCFQNKNHLVECIQRCIKNRNK